MSKTISGTTEMPESEVEDADLFSEEGEAAFAKSFKGFHQKTTPEMAEFGRKLLLYKQHYKGGKGAYGRFLKRARIHPRVAQQYAALHLRISKCERLSYLSGEGIRDLYSKSMPDEMRDGFLKRIRGGEDVPATEIADALAGINKEKRDAAKNEKLAKAKRDADAQARLEAEQEEERKQARARWRNDAAKILSVLHEKLPEMLPRIVDTPVLAMVGEMLFDENPPLPVKTEPDTPTMTPVEAKVETEADEQKAKPKAKGRKVLTPEERAARDRARRKARRTKGKKIKAEIERVMTEAAKRTEAAKATESV